MEEKEKEVVAREEDEAREEWKKKRWNVIRMEEELKGNGNKEAIDE